MLLNLALSQKHAWRLARTLMVCVTLFQSDSGYAVMVSDEFDGDAGSIIHEYDPFGS